jgi:hypothetical protein
MIILNLQNQRRNIKAKVSQEHLESHLDLSELVDSLDQEIYPEVKL